MVLTQGNFVADFLQAKCDFRRKMAVLRFLSPIWGLRGKVPCSSWAHWKARNGLPMIIELFSLGVTAEGL